jgi:hypothetical protein
MLAGTPKLVPCCSSMPAIAPHSRLTSPQQVPVDRMGTDPATSVVDPDCRAHDVYLWICDGSTSRPSVPLTRPDYRAIATRTACRILTT